MSQTNYYSNTHVFTSRSEQEQVELTVGDKNRLDITKVNSLSNEFNDINFDTTNEEIQILDSTDQTIMRVGENDYASTICTVAMGNGITREDPIGQVQGTVLKLECPAPSNHLTCVADGFHTNVKFVNRTNIVGTIVSTTTQTFYNTTSDGNLKEDFAPIQVLDNYLDRMKVYDYKWKNSEERNIGIIAQEMCQIYPKCIAEESGVMMVDYSKLVPILIQANQELHTKIKKLETDVEFIKKVVISN